MKKFPVVIFFILFVISGAQAQQKTGIRPVIKTHSGRVAGTVSSDDRVYIFKGVPYAAPPVDNLRWKSPQPVHSWKGIRNCDQFAPSAMQGKPVPFMMYTSEFLIPAEPVSEDCLYLNIWSPANVSGEKLPVIVWIHGGAFVSGSGSCPIYDGENMARKGVVFVTINYRLGVFGFFAHPFLTRESGNHSSGNYAFLDQVAALQWVQKNIGAFGGDPHRVTIAGQSAGAFSVNALMVSPLAKGLFQRVIAESGGMFSNNGLALSLADAEKNGAQLMQNLNVTTVWDMRKIPAETLLKSASSSRFAPVIDGYVLPRKVYDIFYDAKQNDVPVLTGWNGGDGFPSANDPSVQEYKENAVKKYGNLAEEFLTVFPGNTKEEIRNSLFALNRDQLFAWQAYTWAKLETQGGRNKVFLYQFNRIPPGAEQYGAFHSAEIAYALHSLQMWNKPWTEEDKRLEDIMSSYWINFASSGDPNGDGLPAWLSFDPNSNELMILDTGKLTMSSISALKEFYWMDKYEESQRKR
jgi:para-nitrobenzyl esterase